MIAIISTPKYGGLSQSRARHQQAMTYVGLPACAGLGSSYCKSVNKMHDDPEGTRIALERSHCDGDRHYSTFVSAALVGVTRSIDFASAPKLVLD